MTLITIATVGYSEIRPLSPAGRVFNSVLIFFGVSLLFFAIGLVTQAVVQAGVGGVVRKATDETHDRQTGEPLHRLRLRAGGTEAPPGNCSRRASPSWSWTAIRRRWSAAMRAGLLGLAADSTRDQTLQEAGIGRARGLVAALGTDADNLFVILSAKTLNPMLNVAARAARKRRRRNCAGPAPTPSSRPTPTPAIAWRRP